MWVLIDNYDSFTYILQHYLLQLYPEVKVFKNDEISIAGLERVEPARIIISPGPGRPENAGITNQVIEKFHRKVPLLGVCLGHQALAEFFGARLSYASRPMHGKISELNHTGSGIFKNIPNRTRIMRYHSLVVEGWESTDLLPLAFTENNELMAFEHSIFPSVGLQFHPESVLTEYGFEMLRAWAVAW